MSIRSTGAFRYPFSRKASRDRGGAHGSSREFAATIGVRTSARRSVLGECAVEALRYCGGAGHDEVSADHAAPREPRRCDALAVGGPERQVLGRGRGRVGAHRVALPGPTSSRTSSTSIAAVSATGFTLPIVATHYQHDPGPARYSIRIKFLFYDVFGLDDDDLKEFGATSDSRLTFGSAVGITAWWQLQHQFGYAPLVTRIVIEAAYEVPET